jgi:hypothetical protein
MENFHNREFQSLDNLTAPQFVDFTDENVFDFDDGADMVFGTRVYFSLNRILIYFIKSFQLIIFKIQ